MSTTATPVKDRPILFGSPMVRAILDGRKTQTRRLVKPPPHENVSRFMRVGDGEFKPMWVPPGYPDGEELRFNSVLRCPYGAPGEWLWVRETYAFEQDADGCKPSEVASCTWYAADGDGAKAHATGAYPVGYPRGKWRPSIHMPRWASRITLEVIGVRIERLQSITYDDAIAEGWDPACGQGADDWFAELWGEINGPQSWTTNPWVWVVEFRRAAV